MPVLRCSRLAAGYDGQPVVRGFDVSLDPGEVLAILGPNGAGKTTLLATLAGLVPRLGGEVDVLGAPAPSGNPTAIARRGLVLVPDDRALFTTLTTRENLALAQRTRIRRRPNGSVSLDDVLGWFPELARRIDVRAGLLSGGEQQMLAMARALVQRPRVLLVDELSMGLAPTVVEKLLPIVRRVADDTGAAVILVEQHVRLALGIADRGMVLVHGDVALAGPAADLLADLGAVERAYLGDTTSPQLAAQRAIGS